MRKVIALVVLLVLGAVAVTGTANAFTMVEKVVVADRLTMIARTSAGGFTAEQRIDRINERLAYILGYQLLTPNNIRLIRSAGEPAIFVGDKLLATVTTNDARANNTTVKALAHVWLRNTRLALPHARPYANKYLSREAS